jgi:hypothetical protein
MKLIKTAICSTLFLIASHAYSMPASLAFSSPSLSAQAAGTKEGGKAKKPKKEKKAKGKKGGGVTFHDGSAESRSERDRRLMRECKGRPNSGLCEGYARP